MIMLMDLATAPKTVQVKMGDYCEEITMRTSDLEIIKSFYETCLNAGIFEQESLYEYSDDYYVITLFNEGSNGTEDATEETTPSGDETAD